MKRKYILPFVFAFLIYKCDAQNLIANSGFETYNALPTGPGEWWKVNGWNNVNNYPAFAWPYASPDYLSTNGTGQAHLPNSVYGNVNPFAGNAIMGFVAYYNQGVVDFREYISRPLSSPLIVGKKYDVSFMMTNGISNQYCGSGCNHIGVCFSINPLVQFQHEVINATPQCEINTVWWNTNWQLVTFSFTATAPFQHITIGNFYNDAATTHTVFNNSSPSSFGAYYFIDQLVTAPSAPLPINLLSFTGEFKNNINHLTWTTDNSTGNNYFEVEKSMDAIHFETIGKTNVAVNYLQTKYYSFDDALPHQGSNYYRIKLLESNGDYTYSNIINIENNIDDSFAITCSAIANGVYVLHGSNMKNTSIQVVDADGKIAGQIVNNNSDAEVTIDLSNYDNGIFYVYIFENQKSKSIKLIKL